MDTQSDPFFFLTKSDDDVLILKAALLGCARALFNGTTESWTSIMFRRQSVSWWFFVSEESMIGPSLPWSRELCDSCCWIPLQAARHRKILTSRRSCQKHYGDGTPLFFFFFSTHEDHGYLSWRMRSKLNGSKVPGICGK